MTFKWPWQYEFPPFFTLQPNLSTREKQLEAWASLVLDYCESNRIFTADLSELQNSDLFANTKINRQLNSEGVRAVFDHLDRRRHIDWIDKSHNRCHIYWRRPEEWAKLIYDWVVSNGALNSVCTLYELTQGDDTQHEAFHGLEKSLLLKALDCLVADKKAELLTAGGTEGVKFF